MYCCSVGVRKPGLPEPKLVEPNSPTARAKVSNAPETIAPRNDGRVTCQNGCQRVAPIVADASSRDARTVSKTGLITPKARGNVTKMFARMIAYAVNMI